MDGFIVPARDSQALADTIARLNDDRKLLRAMSSNALLAVLKYDLPANGRLIQKEVSRIRSGQNAPKKSNDQPQRQQPAGRTRSTELA
jgi:glycosyltransferase involved in cell wall biosynthesis